MRLSVDFAADRSGTAELAWGQRDIWEAIQKVGPDNAHYFNVPRLLAVPGAGGPRSPRAVAAALAQVMGRHDALRSLVRLGAEGPYQEVAAAGTLPIETVEVARDAADGAAADLVACLAGRSFGDGEQPLRAGLVVCDGAATHVALVLNHVVADWHAADVVVRDLRMLLLRGAIAGPPPSQLLDLVRDESMASARSDRAIAQWETLLRTPCRPPCSRKRPERARRRDTRGPCCRRPGSTAPARCWPAAPASAPPPSCSWRSPCCCAS
ncbi:hypothetical protein [Microbispora hainanensis]|uniref:hypothetical protein n=1 Tax=Microbispora hainanensis TaxID=568844 RepID=UPI0033D1D882